MRKSVWLLGITAVLLSACGASYTGDDSGGYIRELPEGVLAIVAPYQDLSAVKLDETGCYVYRHVGPVETTFLPLRASNGRPICARPPADVTPAA